MDIKSTIETVKGFPKEFAEIAKELDNAQKIIIFGHKNPDMDCIGSQVSLALAMRERGKEVIIYSNEPSTITWLIMKNYTPIMSKILMI